MPHRLEKAGLSCSTVSSASQALDWDSNPNVLKDPTPHTLVPALCHSAQLTKGLSVSQAPAGSFVLGVTIYLLPIALKEGTALSDCTSDLASQPKAGSPAPQAGVQSSQPQSGESPTTLDHHS